MALTNFTKLTTEQKTAWAKEVWSHARNMSFLSRFMGSGPNAMIQRITTLRRDERGTRAVLTLVADMETDGVVGDNLLENNEEELKAYDQVITVDQLRNANRLEGRIANQKSVVNFREQSRDKLAYWMADRMDQMGLLMLSSVPFTKLPNGADRPARPAGQNLSELEFAPAPTVAPTANRGFHLTSSGINSGTGYNATDGAIVPVTYDALLEARTLAKDLKIRGIRTRGGDDLYHVFMSHRGMLALKRDPAFRDNIRYAWERGKDNPLFNGANSYLVDGMVIHSHDHCFRTTGATAGNKFGVTSGNDDGQRMLLCGAQALGVADLGDGYWVEDMFDYGNQPAISYGKIFGMLKPQFKGNPANPATAEDFSVLCIDTAI